MSTNPTLKNYKFMIKTAHGSEIPIHEYENIGDILKERVLESNQNKYDESIDHRDDYGGDEWFGARSAKEVQQRVLHGWPEGLKECREKLDKLKELYPIRRDQFRKRTRSDRGDFLDIHRVYNGDLSRAWQTTHRQEDRRCAKRVVVAVGNAEHCGIRNSQVMWKTALAILVVDYLYSMGKHIKVITYGGVTDLSEDYRGLIGFSVNLKEFNQPLSMEHLVSTLCVGFFRTYIFRAFMTNYERCTWGLGQPARIKDLESYLSNREGGDVIDIYNVYDKEDAIRRFERIQDQYNRGANEPNRF